MAIYIFGKETRLGSNRMGHAGSHGKKENKRLLYPIRLLLGQREKPRERGCRSESGLAGATQSLVEG